MWASFYNTDMQAGDFNAKATLRLSIRVLLGQTSSNLLKQVDKISGCVLSDSKKVEKMHSLKPTGNICMM